MLLAAGMLIPAILQAKMDSEYVAAQEAVRAAIPYGGGAFTPRQEEGIFVAAGHGMNIVVSRDDGITWEQAFLGSPDGDHGYWAVWNNVAYTGGVFAVSSGWGAPGTVLATDNGETWRHLATADRKPRRKGSKPYDMPTTMHFIGEEGNFVLGLSMTPDFGKTWHSTSAYGFRDADGNRIKIDAAHPTVAYSKTHGRTILVGNSGPGLSSDDFGKTWVPMNDLAASMRKDPAIDALWAQRGAKSIIEKDGVFLILKGEGDSILRSTDGGMTWTLHPLGVERPASRSFGLSIVGEEFWITGNNAKASIDGITWRDLPEAVPAGRIAESPSGTLINVNRGRLSILRSTDRGETWQEVYTYELEGTGGRFGLADVGYGKVNRVR